MTDAYRIVKLANGSFSLRSERYGETFHPVVGPMAEAQALYVNQLDIVRRVRSEGGEFVIWDVGLGAAANPLTFLNAVLDLPARVRIISFDYTTEPLRMALANPELLPYIDDWSGLLNRLLEDGSADATLRSGLKIGWELKLGDFPTSIRTGVEASAPHAIFYDAFSPATNPAMWTLEVV